MEPYKVTALNQIMVSSDPPSRDLGKHQSAYNKVRACLLSFFNVASVTKTPNPRTPTNLAYYANACHEIIHQTHLALSFITDIDQIFPAELIKAFDYQKLGQMVSNVNVMVFVAKQKVQNQFLPLNESPYAPKNSQIHLRLCYKSHKVI